MAAYCYFDILQIHDETAMQEYRSKVLDTVDRFGGKYVVVGGPFETKEGGWQPVFPVMIEFPTLLQAHQWYQSPEYKPLKEKRLQATRGNAVFFEGL